MRCTAIAPVAAVGRPLVKEHHVVFDRERRMRFLTRTDDSSSCEKGRDVVAHDIVAAIMLVETA